MGREPLCLGKALRCRPDLLQRRLIQTDDRGAFQEIEDAEPRGVAGAVTIIGILRQLAPVIVLDAVTRERQRRKIA